MGRPIKSLYFGNRNYPYDNENTGGNSGTGGEGLASVTTATQGSIYINSTNTSFPSLVVSAPNIAGGIQATTAVTWEVDTVTITTGTGYSTGTITSITGLDQYATTPTRFTVTAPGGILAFNAFTDRGEYTNIDGTGITTYNVVGPTGTNGQAVFKFRVKRIAVATAGSGYTTTPSLSWTTLSGTTPSGQTPAIYAASVTQNALSFVSFLTTGTSAISGGDIVKQEASRRYLVRNAQGVGTVKLSAGTGTDHTLEAGGMHLIATDGGGATYYVMKLTAHKAVVVNRTNTSTALISTSTIVIGGVSYTGGDCGWTLGAATGTNQVTLANA